MRTASILTSASLVFCCQSQANYICLLRWAVRILDEWAAGRSQPLPLSALKGAVLGIDASHYLSQRLHQPSTREPLLVALGGFPFALRNSIEKELQALKNLDISCVFVFNGLDFGKKDKQSRLQTESVRAFEHAWELYDQQQADQVVEAFSSAGMRILSVDSMPPWVSLAMR